MKKEVYILQIKIEDGQDHTREGLKMQENTVKTLFNIIDIINDRFPNIDFRNNKVISYNDIVKEYELLMHGTGIRILSSKAFVKLNGEDALDFLHRISTNDIKSLEVNKVADTIFTNEKGRILDFTKVINCETEICLIGGLHNNNILESWLNKFIIMEDIKVTDITEEYVFLELFGSQAETFLIMISGKIISEIEKDKFISIEFFDKKVNFYKSNFSNQQLKYTVIIKNSDFVEILDSILKTDSVFDFGFIGEEAYDVYRIENIVPRFPNELNDNFNPHEVNLLGSVSFTKGCYIGQEVIARLDTYDKVQRVLKKVCASANISFDELPVELINDEDDVCGYLTSFVDSELLNKKIGLALIRKKNLDQDLFVNQGNNKIQLKVK